jgi:hypothetical protein
LKRELAGFTLSVDQFKKKWEGVVTRTLIKDNLARAFQKWLGLCN